MLRAVHVLFTGFEPFGGYAHNPSEAALDLLPDEIDGAVVRRAVLPVDTHRIAQALRPLWRAGPAVVVHAGLAENRTGLSVERIAYNELAFERPDNAGCLKRAGEIVEEGPQALLGRIDVGSVEKAWAKAGLQGYASGSAGRFLCNQAYYLSLYHLPWTTAVAFVHLPPDEKLEPGRCPMTLDEQATGLTLVAQTALSRSRSAVSWRARA